jgi:hypothetical protein
MKTSCFLLKRLGILELIKFQTHKFFSMKNFIFAICFLSLFSSCKPENGSEPQPNPSVDVPTKTRELGVNDLIGTWEDTNGLSSTSNNPTNQKQLFRLNSDGTYLFSFQLPISIPPAGTWTFDAAQNLVSFLPNNDAGGVAKYYWAIGDYNGNELNLISSIEPLYTVDGQVPAPTHISLHLFKKG